MIRNTRALSYNGTVDGSVSSEMEGNFVSSGGVLVERTRAKGESGRVGE